MQSGNTVSLKSFQSYMVNDGLLAKAVEAIKAGEKEARSTGTVQSFELFYKGFRQNIAIGRVYVIPPSVADKKGQDFPTALLYGCLVRTYGGEELGDLISHKIGDSEWDEYSQASYDSIKEELFGTGKEGKFASLILFAPNWVNKREYIGFQFSKDDNELANLTRHLIFSSYFDPALSSAFDALMTDVETSKFDVTDITPKMNFPALAENPLKEFPLLTKQGSTAKPRLALTRKNADAVKQEVLEPAEMDVFESLDQALRNSLLPSDTKGVEDASEGKAPTKGEMVPRLAAAYQPKTGQPCTCKPGVQRDNCPQCEGTGQKIDFAAIRNRNKSSAVECEKCEGAGCKFCNQKGTKKADATAVHETKFTNVGPGTEAHAEADQRTEGYVAEKDVPKAVINSAPIGIALDETGVPRRKEEERKEGSAKVSFAPDVYPVKDPNAFFKEHDYRPDAACVCGQSHVGQQPCRYCGEPTKFNFCSQACAKANNDLMAQHPDAASPEEVHGRPSVMGSAKKSNWTMKCPWCSATAMKQNPQDNYKCTKCEWDSTKGDKAMAQHASVAKVAFVAHVPGHKDSKGNAAPWVIKDHKSGKILSSHKTKAQASQHLQDMHAHRGSAKDKTAEKYNGTYPEAIGGGWNKATADDLSSQYSKQTGGYFEKDDAPDKVRDHIKKNLGQARQGQDAVKDHAAAIDAEKWGGLGKKQASSLWVGSAKKIAAEFDDFTRGYIETALWSSNDESDASGGEPLDANYDIRDLAPSCMQAMTEDCAKFQVENSELLEAAGNQDGQDEFRQGHDFWLTRNGHGAGYWDGDYPTTGDGLTEASKAFGDVDLYVGDDDMIYQMGSEDLKPGWEGQRTSSKAASKKTASQNDASYIASLIAGGPQVDGYDARSTKSKSAAEKREEDMARKYGSQRKKFADVPTDIDDIWAETMEEMGPAPEISLPGEDNPTHSEADVPAEMKSNEPEKTKGNQEAPTVKVEEALENDTTKKDEPKPSTGDGGAAADSKETKTEGGSKSEWAKNRSKGKSEKKDEPKEEKKEEPKKEESKEASAKTADEPLETSTIETVDPENWESVQAELLNNGYAEECPSCGAVSAYSWEDANYCENCTEPMGLDLPEQDRIYHIGASSSFEWECGKCRASWTPADSPINAEVYTHRDPNAEFGEIEGSVEQMDAMLASDEKTAGWEALDAGDQFCTQCGRPMVIGIDSPGVSNHLTDEGGIDYNADADHVPVADDANMNFFAAEKTADTADNEYNIDSAASPTDSETGESATVKCHKEHDQQVKKADVADNPENEKGDKVAGRTKVSGKNWARHDENRNCTRCGKEWTEEEINGYVYHECPSEFWDKTAGRTITPKYVIRIPGSTDAAWDVGTRGQLRGAGQPNDANLARYMDALLKSMEPGGHNEHLIGHFDPQEAAVYRNDGTYANPLATWSRGEAKQSAEKTALGPCMCGDPNCPSCGSAMGTWPPASCPICNVPAEDCLTHFDEDGEVRPEFVAEIKAAEELYAQEQAKADQGFAESLQEDSRLAEEFWNEEAKAQAEHEHLSSDVSGDIAEAKSEVVSPDTVDADIKQPTESVEETGKQAAGGGYGKTHAIGPCIECGASAEEGHKSGCSYERRPDKLKKDEKKDAAAPAVALEGGEFPYVETLIGMGWDDTGEPGHFMKDSNRVEILTHHDGYEVYVDGELYESGDNVDELHNVLEIVAELGIDSLNAHQAPDGDVPSQVDDKTACAGYGDEEDEESPIDLGLGDLADLVIEKEDN